MFYQFWCVHDQQSHGEEDDEQYEHDHYDHRLRAELLQFSSDWPQYIILIKISTLFDLEMIIFYLESGFDILLGYEVVPSDFYPVDWDSRSCRRQFDDDILRTDDPRTQCCSWCQQTPGQCPGSPPDTRTAPPHCWSPPPPSQCPATRCCTPHTMIM